VCVSTISAFGLACRPLGGYGWYPILDSAYCENNIMLVNVDSPALHPTKDIGRDSDPCTRIIYGRDYPTIRGPVTVHLLVFSYQTYGNRWLGRVPALHTIYYTQ